MRMGKQRRRLCPLPCRAQKSPERAFECYVNCISRMAVLVGNLIPLPGCGHIAGEGYKDPHFVACLILWHLSSPAALGQNLRTTQIIFTH